MSTVTPSLTSQTEPLGFPRHGLTAPLGHIVQFYDGEDRLTQVVADFLCPGFLAGEPMVLIATPAHRSAYCRELSARNCDIDAARSTGQLTLLDADATLETFMVDGMPNWDAFFRQIGGVLRKVSAAFPGRPIRAYGEMVDLLWRNGQRTAAISLEEFWNEISKTHSFSLLCTYLMGNFYRDADREQFQHICRTHSHVQPTEEYVDSDDPAERLRQVSLLQQHALALKAELQDRKQLEEALRVALAEKSRAEEETRRSKAELQDFVENAAEGLHWVSAEGIILWANKSELELLGYSRDEYVGHHIAEFHADKDVIDDILERLGRNETLKGYEARLLAKDGSIKYVRINSNVYRVDGKFVHTRCFSRDVTDRKAAENGARQRYEFEQQLIGIVSHDLRNPISAITMSAALARGRTSDERVAKALTRITASAERAVRIISDLLDLTQARLGGGISIQLKPASMLSIAHEVVDEHRAAHPEREILLETEHDFEGVWDAERVAQALSNLVSNAIHHSPNESPVRVQLRGGEHDVSIVVQNQGPAIPPELQEKLFAPFKRGSEKRPGKGLGLGLYIVERIATVHGGTVRCHSVQGDTSFTLALPYRCTPPKGNASVPIFN